MKKILVTGCLGQLGKAVQKEFAGEAELICTDVINGLPDVVFLDITDPISVLDIVSKTNPDIIINCAAYTDVDGCEKNYDIAYGINTIGPKNLAIAAAQTDARIVHISTDYVFRGDEPDALDEGEKPDPISAYGKTKLKGEQAVKENCKKHYIFRTAWLYGEGKNFVNTMLKLAENKDEIKVVDDQIGSPTSATELARVIKQVITTDEYGLYHATCEGSTSWAGFAKKIFEEAKKDTKVIPISSEEYKELNPASADRPKFSVLDNKNLRDRGFNPMKNWEDAFVDYMITEVKL